MKQRNKILLLSTFAKDILLNPEGKVLRVQNGGPAFFIRAALDEEKISFDMPYKSRLKVDILLTDKGEFGRIKQRLNPIKVNWFSVNQPIIFISGVLDEFDLDKIEDYKGQVFIDIQGYVRNGLDFGKKKLWRRIPKNAVCLKGTIEEVSYLPKEAVQNQKKKMLLITNGSKGSTLYFNDSKITIKPEMRIKLPDSIGAGDTFFAYFVAKLLRSNDPEKSLEYATSKTTSFLSSKIHHHTNPF